MSEARSTNQTNPELDKALKSIESIEKCPIDQECRLLLECDKKNIIAELQAQLESANKEIARLLKAAELLIKERDSYRRSYNG